MLLSELRFKIILAHTMITTSLSRCPSKLFSDLFRLFSSLQNLSFYVTRMKLLSKQNRESPVKRIRPSPSYSKYNGFYATAAGFIFSPNSATQTVLIESPQRWFPENSHPALKPLTYYYKPGLLGNRFNVPEPRADTALFRASRAESNLASQISNPIL